MGALLAVFVAANALSAPPILDPQHLPRLPDRGLVHTTPGGVELETLQGRRLGVLRSLHVAQTLGAHGGLLQDRHGNFFTIDRFERRVRCVDRMNVTAPSGCTFTDEGARTRVYVCGPRLVTVSGDRRRVVARAPGMIGHWAWADLSPDETSILGQWSAECESPVALLIVGGKAKPFGGSMTVESLALEWLADGRAVVHFPAGVCGAGSNVPGIYAVPRRGRAQLLQRVSGRATAWTFGMWGG